MTHTCNLLALSLALAVSYATSATAAIVVSDDTFNNGDWAITVYASSGGPILGSGQSSGGNPGPYRQMTHVLPGTSNVGVFHRYTAFSYDPSTSGAIEAINYQEDQRITSAPFSGAAVGATAAILQDGIIYFGPNLTFSNTTWQTVVANGLTESSFTSATMSNPDFSSSGGAIFFGYARSNTNSSINGMSIQHGIDNWSFTIVPQTAEVPEPATFAIWCLGSLTCAGAALRRKYERASGNSITTVNHEANYSN